MGNKQDLNNAFRTLRQRGFFARQNFEDCMSCACAALPEGDFQGYIYYHQQDAARLREKNGCMIRFCEGKLPAREVGVSAVVALQEFGVHTEWNQDPSRAIFIKLEVPLETALSTLFGKDRM
ncbi:hypothetical protein C4561_01625 [candidate division WWE3 bacterium]|uniref:DUF6891 domain-containing protein n=1 Tax=candidate division WWE3 bacterium TaxID=2053526 RepID=A0A3A4ZF31_UNCKA|nr:MAG: hypothetical protein C4561_01625 [candidate division WWE3 bacterium]